MSVSSVRFMPLSSLAMAPTSRGQSFSVSLSLPPKPVSLQQSQMYLRVSFSVGGAQRVMMSSMHTSLYLSR